MLFSMHVPRSCVEMNKSFPTENRPSISNASQLNCSKHNHKKHRDRFKHATMFLIISTKIDKNETCELE